MSTKVNRELLGEKIRLIENEICRRLARTLSDRQRVFLDVRSRIKSRKSIERKFSDHRTSIIHDLVGLRIVVAHSGLLETVGRIANDVVEENGFVLEERHNYSAAPRLGGYRAEHYRFSDPSASLLVDHWVGGIEVQLLTAAWRMHSEVSYLLAYKSKAPATDDLQTLELLGSRLDGIDSILKRLL